MDFWTRDYESCLSHNYTHGLFANDFWLKSGTNPVLFLKIVQDPDLLKIYIKYFKYCFPRFLDSMIFCLYIRGGNLWRRSRRLRA